MAAEHNEILPIEWAEYIVENSVFNPVEKLLSGDYSLLGNVVLSQKLMIELAQKVERVTEIFIFNPDPDGLSDGYVSEDCFYFLEDDQRDCLLNTIRAEHGA